MKTHPILFSTEMVQAILAGKKTMTRRPIKGIINENPDDWQFEWMDYSCKKEWRFTQKSTVNEESLKNRDFIQEAIRCPYGKVALNDQLWVRETWQHTKCLNIHPSDEESYGYVYRANGDPWEDFEGWRWKPSIFMPREASRITLEVINVRVERLWDISEEDAKAEGVQEEPPFTPFNMKDKPSFKAGFFRVWENIHGQDSHCGAKNWVWVIEFKRIMP